MKKAAASVAAPEALSFEQALDELDALVRRMESGELSLDDSMAAYRRGAELARICQGKLAQPAKSSVWRGLQGSHPSELKAIRKLCRGQLPDHPGHAAFRMGAARGAF
jgi:exodeoxyribonuclease VII small subunit